MVLRIAFVGSRGMPAKYGGNEVFAEELARRLVTMGFEIYVTCESHTFDIDEYCGITRIHIPSIQGKSITIPFLNDILATFCLLVKCPRINLIYYVSPPGALAVIPVPRLLGKKVVVNTDGIEWKRLAIRKRFSSVAWKLIFTLVSWGLKFEERMDAKLSNVVIADSRVIKAYLEESYKAKNVVYISYGARELINSDTIPEKEHGTLDRFGLSTGEYYLTVGRIVAENNIHKEIEGFKRSKSSRKLVIVGNFNEKDDYTKYLIKLRNGNSTIIFSDPIYDKEVLGILRKNCYAYVHAYELGGTNPSLLEQMLFKKPILAHDVPFHREILQEGGIYFKSENELAECIGRLEGGEFDLEEIAKWQALRVEEEYNWDGIAQQYDKLFRELCFKGVNP